MSGTACCLPGMGRLSAWLPGPAWGRSGGGVWGMPAASPAVGVPTGTRHAGTARKGLVRPKPGTCVLFHGIPNCSKPSCNEGALWGVEADASTSAASDPAPCRAPASGKCAAMCKWSSNDSDKNIGSTICTWGNPASEARSRSAAVSVPGRSEGRGRLGTGVRPAPVRRPHTNPL